MSERLNRWVSGLLLKHISGFDRWIQTWVRAQRNPDQETGPLASGSKRARPTKPFNAQTKFGPFQKKCETENHRKIRLTHPREPKRHKIAHPVKSTCQNLGFANLPWSYLSYLPHLAKYVAVFTISILISICKRYNDLLIKWAQVHNYVSIRTQVSISALGNCALRKCTYIYLSSLNRWL